MNIILFGPPGVGKGTQAKLIANEFNIPHISTGDILRNAIANETPIGLKAKSIMERGELVTDNVMIEIIKDTLSNPICKNGFIIDGFPRTIPQAKGLENLLSEINTKISFVINFEINEIEIIKRLQNRLSCIKCGSVFNSIIDSLNISSNCPKCNSQLVHRNDDESDTVKKRIQIYNASTSPLKNFYLEKKLLVSINGVGEIQKIFDNVIEKIKEKKYDRIN